MYRVGLLHSIYNAAGASTVALTFAERPTVQSLLGKRSEELVYMNCVFPLSEFSAVLSEPNQEVRMRDQRMSRAVRVTRAQLDDLCRIRLADRLEQLPRAQNWDYSRDVFFAMAKRLGNVLVNAYRSVYAAELPSGQSHDGGPRVEKIEGQISACRSDPAGEGLLGRPRGA